MYKKLISIIIPVYGNKNLVKMLYDKLTKNLCLIEKIEYEIIMINDNCPYGSGEEITKLALTDKKIKFIDLTRNFGQHYAIKAGIDHANGDYAIIMDCDLQDNPEDIIKFYNKIIEGYDVVFGIRVQRKDNLLKKIISKFYRMIEKFLCDYSSGNDHGNFSIISKKVIELFKQIKDYNFNYITVINFLGFKPGYIDISKDQRVLGKSGYNLSKGLNLALKSIIANSNKPLVFSAYCTFLMFILCFIFIIKLFFDYYFKQINLLGWTSIMVSIFFIGGLIFAYLSILGLYIGGIFKEVKDRPLYIIKRTINIE